MLIWNCSTDGLNPQFKADIEDLLTASAYDWHVTSGYRSLDEQDALYQAHLHGGPLATTPGNSAHNYGLAVDVALIMNGKEDWNESHPAWQWLFSGILASPRLHSGRGFGDADHIERLNWRAFKHWTVPAAVPEQMASVVVSSPSPT